MLHHEEIFLLVRDKLMLEKLKNENEDDGNFPAEAIDEQISLIELALDADREERQRKTIH
ncbi:hypothetical protein [Alkalihalobacillus trypoxylicola]|uniref:Uncharacterized protein n=1 Tax=Alkalihalobacillus trypoxylicola TaxID=519424 RepID=A0A161Q1L4_9BACI|nr:hypothetical protein [Alkalihalobacillus trypoxylicola]KYG29393.1 hypothetical protein AZF04_07665 [Alkalihalobacillus trypoxylicola]